MLSTLVHPCPPRLVGPGVALSPQEALYRLREEELPVRSVVSGWAGVGCSARCWWRGQAVLQLCVGCGLWTRRAVEASATPPKWQSSWGHGPTAGH